ncbi:MAG: isocitrate/isopropylmalate dehydrogenase family protein [Thaumarchaeota archaeon]|nr:isocitrate/isopropylmalate dehydrogenase family protein [Nitrososphaerota archaeon]
MRYEIALIRGDGIGPEQVEATLKVLSKVKEILGVNFELVEVEAGDECFRRRGKALPDETVEALKRSHACLKGPVGETAAEVIVKLRQMFDLYANVRPAKSLPRVPALRSDVDFVIVRENTEGLYKGYEYEFDGAALAFRIITRRGCERIANYAFELARKRRKKVVAVHKANVMKLTCGLFAKTCRAVSKKYPDVSFSEMYVDAAAMNLIRKPHEFDVIVTTNMFGDILSDEAAQVVGGLGLGPAANIGDAFAIFEPVHGCAPDIAGKGVANPTSMILSAAMMFDWLSSKYGDERCRLAAKLIEESVKKTLERGVLTPDLGGTASTSEFGDKVAELLSKLSEKT